MWELKDETHKVVGKCYNNGTNFFSFCVDWFSIKNKWEFDLCKEVPKFKEGKDVSNSNHLCLSSGNKPVKTTGKWVRSPLISLTNSVWPSWISAAFCLSYFSPNKAIIQNISYSTDNSTEDCVSELFWCNINHRMMIISGEQGSCTWITLSFHTSYIVLIPTKYFASINSRALYLLNSPSTLSLLDLDWVYWMTNLSSVSNSSKARNQ